MVKRISMFLFVLAMAFAMVAPAAAAGDGPVDINPNSPSSGGMGGVVPPYGQARPTGFIANLTYHGGPVMHTNKTYTIFWVPAGYSMATSYRSGMNTFLKNVAADNGLTSNVYFSDTQYYGPTAANILYQSGFVASYNDTNPYPASGCALASGFNKCLSDGQLRKEISRVISLNKWRPTPATMFFIFTPGKVRSCFGSSCSFTSFCAYHSYFGSVIYANQPFANYKPNSCGIKYATLTPPNGAAIDSTINVLSHEHNEAITDPKLDAWWDGTTGNENGDNCAWDFGTLTAGSYNQVINGHNYVVQQEWSNASSGCVLSGW